MVNKKNKISKPDITAIEATVASITKEIIAIKSTLQKIEEKNWNIVIGVIVAFLFTLGLAVLEIVLFHTRSNNESIGVQKQMIEMEYKFQKEIDILKEKISTYKSK